MKKLAIGLLVGFGVLVLLFVGGATVFYYSYYKPYASGLTTAGIGQQLERKLVNQAAFVPPQNRELTAEQVARFLEIERQIEARVGERIGLMREQCERLERTAGGDRRGPTVRDAMQPLGAITRVYAQSKEIQVRALNEAGFSLDEFEWIRTQVYAAAGLPLARFDLGELLRVTGEGGPGLLEQEIAIRRNREPAFVPEQNKALAQPHRSQLEAWRALAFFGL